MIKCDVKNKKEVFDYIGKDYGRCAYLYIDLKKYGFENENIHIWYGKDNGGDINVLVMQYYNGMHIYSRKGSFDAEDVVKLIKERKPTLVCGMKDTIDRVSPYFSKEEYVPEYGNVMKLETHTGVTSDSAYRASREDLKEVAELLAADEHMGAPYGFDLLFKQLKERYDEKFGRNWIYRDDKGIASHVATYAEIEGIAVVSGGIVRPDCRGNNEYAKILGAMCRELKDEGIEVISYFYGEGGAKRAHEKVGFEVLGDWAKLVRQ